MSEEDEEEVSDSVILFSRIKLCKIRCFLLNNANATYISTLSVNSVKVFKNMIGP